MAPRPYLRPRCHNCRRKKIKCDYEHPACRRCVASGQTCEGYDTGLAIIMYSANPGQTPSVTRQSHDGRSGAEASGPGIRFASDLPRKVPGRKAVSKIPSAVVPSLESRLDPFFQSLFASSAGDSHYYGTLSFLPTILQEGKETDAFHVVSRTFSYVCMANRNLSAPMADVQRVAAHSRCLVAVQSTLATPSKRSYDATLAAVWLLGILELVNGSPPASGDPSKLLPEAWSLQCQGLEALLKLRGHRKCGAGTTDGIFWSLFAPIPSRYLVCEQPIPPIFDEWLDDIEAENNPDQAIAVATARFSSSAISAISRVAALFRFRAIEDADSLLAEVMLELNLAEQRFDSVVPHDKHALASAAHKDPYITTALSLYYASAIKAHHYVAILCAYIRSGDATQVGAQIAHYQRYESLMAIHRFSAAVIDHCELVLQRDRTRQDAAQYSWTSLLRLLMPLTLVSQLPTSCPSQKAIAREYLTYIGDSGIRQSAWSQQARRKPGDLPASASWSADVCSCSASTELSALN